MIAENTDWPGQLSWRYLSLSFFSYARARIHTHTDLNNSGRHPQNSMPFHQLSFWSIPPLLQALPRVSPGSWALVMNWLLKLEILPFKKRKPPQNLYSFSPRKEKRDVCLPKLWTESKSIAFKPVGYLSLPDLLWIWYLKALRLCWNTIMQITRNAAGMADSLPCCSPSTQPET